MPLDLDKLRKLIGDRSQTDVARAAGMARPNLSRILAGRRVDVPISTVDRLAAALGCKPHELLK